MITPKQVSFLSRGVKIAGHLYIPPQNAQDRKHAAIVVGHPTTGVKEQTAGLYASLLAAAGFVALAFDAAYQGESGGDPHGLEDPYQRAEDFKAAVTYLSTVDGAVALIDPQRIGVLGICASGGYVSFAAQTDPRMRAIATISAGCMGSVTRHGVESIPLLRVSPEHLAATLEQSAKARVDEAKTGKTELLVMLPQKQSDLPAELPERSMMREAISYYRTPRASHPRSTSKEVAWSVDLRANYDSFAFNHLISPRPLLMIAGSEAETAYMSRRGIENAKEPKELFIIEGKSHVDLYDDTSETLPKVLDFMGKHLCA